MDAGIRPGLVPRTCSRGHVRVTSWRSRCPAPSAPGCPRAVSSAAAKVPGGTAACQSRGEPLPSQCGAGMEEKQVLRESSGTPAAGRGLARSWVRPGRGGAFEESSGETVERCRLPEPMPRPCPTSLHEDVHPHTRGRPGRDCRLRLLTADFKNEVSLHLASALSWATCVPRPKDVDVPTPCSMHVT